VLWIRAHDLVTLDVLEVVHEDALTQHINKVLNVHRHFFLIVGLY